jgi:hypothetical protein
MKKWLPVALVCVAVVAVAIGFEVAGLENMAYDPKPGG